MPDPPLPASSETKACPECGETMENGFLALGGRANWVKQQGVLDASIFRGETIVGLTDRLPYTAHLRGWRCEDCALMLLEY